jgi:hypothetical protein
MATYTITSPNGKTLKITGENPPTEAELDEIFAEVDKPDKKTKPLNPIEYWQATPEQRNENVKALAQQKLDARKEWETKNPFVSRLQEEYQPFYLAEKKDLEHRAKYGNYAPLPEKIKKIGNTAFAAVLPYANAARDTALATISRGKAGFLPTVGREAAIGAVQGGTSEALNEMAKNGLSPNTLKKFGQGAGIGGTVGAVAPAVSAVANKAFLNIFPGLKEKTVQQLIKPNSQALDLNEETAQNLLMDTTENVRESYQDLLNKKAADVENAINNLKTQANGVDALTLMSDINDTFNQYGGKKINPARNMTGKLESDLYELIAKGADERGDLAPIDLQKAKEQIGKMVKWDDATAANYYNPILEQVYGKYNTRLSQLSPELAEANAAYSQLNDFMKNEGVRKILRNGDNIDAASSTLRNYNNTVTKGNTNRNIQDLENLLVSNGYEPFLNKIDDVNAANELLKTPQTGWNIMDIMQKVKDTAERPVLLGARKINQLGEKIKPLTDNVKLQRLLPPAAVMSTSPMLYGGVEYNDYR